LVSGTPCTGVASACYEDTLQDEGFACFCPNGRNVAGNEDCPDETIISCFLPFNPCDPTAICIEEQNASGQVTEVFCQCVEASGSNVTVPFDQACTSV
jgi:hypothetical protein